MPPRRRRARRVSVSSVVEFLSVEALGGIGLVMATLAALVWANTSLSSYSDVWDTTLKLGVGDLALTESLRHWINDGLMTVFFFVVGLEVKREIVRGELRDPRTASLPILAAVGGMVVPALLFTLLNTGGTGARGWAIPMATDIAFAIAILAVLGSRIVPGVKLFLLTLAIADDIGAIAVIAIFYSDSVSPGWIAGGVVAILATVVMQRLRIASPIAYVVPAIILWVCVFESGIHATIAGVALGLLTPARPFRGKHIIEGLEHRFHPWSSFLIVPLFALANTGIALGGSELKDAASSPISWGIVLGLVVGKPLGIMAATLIGLRTRLGRLPEGVQRVHILGAGLLAGIGFTVALFVASLSFPGAALGEAKVGILAASTLSALAGTLVFVLGAGRHRNRSVSHRSALPRTLGCWLGTLVMVGVAGVTLGLADSRPAGAASASCAKKPFTGTIVRTADTASAQPAADRKTSEIRSARVYDFGTRKNYTIYVADYALSKRQLGSTVTAPAGKLLVTLFLRAANDKDLRNGQTLDIAKDPVTAIVDTGGGARAVTSNKQGSVKILSLSSSRLCFKIDYRDTYQQVKGTVSAKIP